jgi:hypothetical protein
MHLPGYIQGGQEASYGCLLLGIYHRRIPGATVTFKTARKNRISSNTGPIKNFFLQNLNILT